MFTDESRLEVFSNKKTVLVWSPPCQRINSVLHLRPDDRWNLSKRHDQHCWTWNLETFLDDKARPHRADGGCPPPLRNAQIERLPSPILSSATRQLLPDLWDTLDQNHLDHLTRSKSRRVQVLIGRMCG